MALTRRVSHSVVQVQVSGYGPVDGTETLATNLILARRHSLGSGVIVDADGYIVTNAHVIAGAERVQVGLHEAVDNEPPIASIGADSSQMLDAKVIGIARDVDLAVLKIDRQNLQPLPIADYDDVRQGQLVFAVRKPGGVAGLGDDGDRERRGAPVRSR
jgi:serine protease Do